MCCVPTWPLDARQQHVERTWARRAVSSMPVAPRCARSSPDHWSTAGSGEYSMPTTSHARCCNGAGDGGTRRCPRYNARRRRSSVATDEAATRPTPANSRMAPYQRASAVTAAMHPSIASATPRTMLSFADSRFPRCEQQHTSCHVRTCNRLQAFREGMCTTFVAILSFSPAAATGTT
ncbi:conserved hypothetical protein [Xanthomonas citri pv. fuscans]|nr:conserved hypothetical protein [Xanthomonas citri pv. fuscans]SOO01811.1 conserved hypothetical protein [Xanthomonas citri pv. fuscans]SOO04156.1 conserved hypothetical protein [Xanthomonas citri pv. fuscans]SOO16594.1 conserved hypothetical protein [Xanthomonas citri pv. fuscans]SOO43772.1 conserved hypothetical protein [Xanthomonas citri pv. fuscans]